MHSVHRLKPKPPFAKHLMSMPARPMGQVRGPVAPPGTGRCARGGGVQFALMNMHCGVGKVREPTGVVQVQVRGHNVPYVIPRKTQGLDLGQSRCRLGQARAGHPHPTATKSTHGVMHICSAYAGLHQDKARAGFKQQAVADHTANGQRAHAAAVKMMNFHGLNLRAGRAIGKHEDLTCASVLLIYCWPTRWPFGIGISQGMAHMNVPPIQLLYAFEAAARCGSFKRAAAELHVTPSAVSQQVKTLEDQLGMSLFHRLPRAVTLSDAGAAFFAVAAETLACYRRGAERFLAAHTQTPLRVSMQPFIAYELAIPQLHVFHRAHPHIDLRLETSSTLADIPGGEVDAGVRFGVGPWPGLAATRLCAVTAGLVCAPALVDSHNRLLPTVLADGMLVMVPSMKARVRERLVAADLGARLPPRDLVLDTFLATMHAAEQGLGVAVALFPIAERWLRSGRLVAPWPARFPLKETYRFVCRHADANTPRMVAVRRWLQQLFAELENGQTPAQQRMTTPRR